jgi:hypothetical protein
VLSFSPVVGIRNSGTLAGERGGGRVPVREVVYMERPLEPNMGPFLADVLL